MTVHIDEVSTTIEPSAPESEDRTAASAGEPSAVEVQIEELRPLVRTLVSEEIERWLRTRSDCP